MVKVRIVAKTQVDREVEVITEPEMLSYLQIDDMPVEQLEVISIEIVEA